MILALLILGGRNKKAVIIMSNSAAIIIPARYGSTRFPGKPLAMIAGQSMLSRVIDLARRAVQGIDDIQIAVATDDERIIDHAKELGTQAIMTGACKTGSDRVLDAAHQMDNTPDIILNLQGDAPFIPVSAVRAVLQTLMDNPDIPVATPVVNLSWEKLDHLRENKIHTPFSGTTCTRRNDGRAMWFSKQIIPAVRKEDRESALSPIYQHLGLYGYRLHALSNFCALPEGHYEKLEGLEQLRFLENDIPVYTAEITEMPLYSGIDSPDDLSRVEKLINTPSS